MVKKLTSQGNCYGREGHDVKFRNQYHITFPVHVMSWKRIPEEKTNVFRLVNFSVIYLYLYVAFL